MKTALRAIIFMVALAILTAALVAGTLSNYITKEGKQDSATASKFGVVLRISEGSAFETAYTSPEGTDVTVSAATPTVAPGTADNGGVLITVTGTPEVKTRLKFDLIVKSDVFLQLSATESYHPLVFTFSKVGDASGDIAPVVLKEGTLEEISAYLKNGFPLTEHAVHDPNTDLKAVYRLNWAWAFEESAETDAYDTTLGDLAAAIDPVPDMVAGKHYSVTLAYDLTVTVMQID